MPHLAQPDLAQHASFVAAVREFHAHPSPPPWFVASLDPDALESPEEFAAYVADLRAQPLEETPRPAGFVPATTLWRADGAEPLTCDHDNVASLRVIRANGGRYVDRRGHKLRFLVAT